MWAFTSFIVFNVRISVKAIYWKYLSIRNYYNDFILYLSIKVQSDVFNDFQLLAFFWELA